MFTGLRRQSSHHQDEILPRRQYCAILAIRQNFTAIPIPIQENQERLYWSATGGVDHPSRHYSGPFRQLHLDRC